MRLQLDTSVGTANSSVGSANDLQQTAATGTAGSSRSLATNADRGNDQAQISGIANILANSATERSARIEQLKTSVQAGTYQASSTAASQAIVSQALP